MAVLRIRLTAKLANLIYLLRLNNSTMCLRYVMLTGRMFELLESHVQIIKGQKNNYIFE